ncbi:MAG: lamin tail domain-containing protein [Dehalococcoidia bacterium]
MKRKKKLLIGLASLAVLGIIIGIILYIDNRAPAEFEISSLNVSPEEVEPGETVTVTVEVQNIGGRRGTYELELKINGIVEQSESVTLDGGETTSISFFVEKEMEGSHSVELDESIRIFEVVPGTLTVHFIDVGQGDSILLDLGDIEVLIDGGEKSPGVVSYIDDYVDGSLEVMIATHPHADHIGGLIAVLDAFEVDEIWLNGDTSTSQTYSQFMSAVDSEGAEMFVARRGDTIQAGNLTFNVLHPVNLSGTTNDNSIVLSLSYGQVDFLFTGDAEQQAEASILAEGIVPDVEVLKVGHHGSRTASSIQFLQAAKPEYAIYMAGQGNSYGHPHQETICNLWEIDAEIYGTDIHGTIVITTDGETYNLLPSNNVPPVACPTTTLTISVNGQGTTNPSVGAHEYDSGAQVTITASPASGWEFDHWSGTDNNAINPTTITMNSNKSVTAYFEKETCVGSNVQITYIFYDGAVPRTESDEYVEITNLGDTSQELKGWVLKDISEGYPSFTFPSYVLAPGAKIRVYTNEIHSESGGFSFRYGKAIWHNTVPDWAALYNAQGQEVSRKSY